MIDVVGDRLWFWNGSRQDKSHRQLASTHQVPQGNKDITHVLGMGTAYMSMKTYGY